MGNGAGCGCMWTGYACQREQRCTRDANQPAGLIRLPGLPTYAVCALVPGCATLPGARMAMKVRSWRTMAVGKP